MQNQPGFQCPIYGIHFGHQWFSSARAGSTAAMQSWEQKYSHTYASPWLRWRRTTGLPPTIRQHLICERDRKGKCRTPWKQDVSPCIEPCWLLSGRVWALTLRATSTNRGDRIQKIEDFRTWAYRSRLKNSTGEIDRNGPHGRYKKIEDRSTCKHHTPLPVHQDQRISQMKMLWLLRMSGK